MTNEHNQHMTEQQRLAVKLNHLLPLACIQNDKEMLDSALAQAKEHFTTEELIHNLIEGLTAAHLTIHNWNKKAAIAELQSVMLDLSE